MQRHDRGNSLLASDGLHVGWSSIRASHQVEEKTLLAAHFVEHDFLVPRDASPETDPRMTVASVFVTQGTTPNTVVESCTAWMADNELVGPFFITWFTTGALVPATLRRFRTQNPEMRHAAQLFLFPGQVDQGVEGVSGPEAEDFATRLQRSFTYSLLSAYAFDPLTGHFFFHFSSEVRLQRACASLYADHKFIFLDSSKFRREGEVGYDLKDLLATARSVTFYSGPTDCVDVLRQSFESLFEATLSTPDSSQISRDVADSQQKTLRLELVGRNGLPSRSVRRMGVLRKIGFATVHIVLPERAVTASVKERLPTESASWRVVSDDAGNSFVIHHGIQFHGYLVKEEELQSIEEKSANIGTDLNVAIASMSTALSVVITLLMAWGSINGARLTMLVALTSSCLCLGIDRLRRHGRAKDTVSATIRSIRQRGAVDSST